MRLDKALALVFPDYSRSALKAWILQGRVLLDSNQVMPRHTVNGGEGVRLCVEPQNKNQWRPQPIAFNILYEDDDLIVIDKPAGLVVHPGAGNLDGTLANALLNHDAGLAALPRAGVVHRLDKETSGVMVVARSLRAHTHLVAQIQAKQVVRFYEAVVNGVMTGGGTVDVPIGRHPVRRTRMATVTRGKPAVTHYRVFQRFRAHTHIGLHLETGRTHQIRVHMAHLRYPLVGDPLYGGRLRLPRVCHPDLGAALKEFKRQALHARRLTLNHPASGERLVFASPLAEDITLLLRELRQDLEVAHGRDRA